LLGNKKKITLAKYAFFAPVLFMFITKTYTYLELALKSPPKPHALVSLAIKSSVLTLNELSKTKILFK